jgi:hypothetical protein
MVQDDPADLDKPFLWLERVVVLVVGVLVWVGKVVALTGQGAEWIEEVDL